MTRGLPARRLDAPLALAAGALHSVTFVLTPLWPLSLALIGSLALVCGRRSARHAAVIGLSFGVGWIATGTWWLYISMHRYGGLPAVLAVLAVLALASFLALYFALAMAAFARWRGGRPFADALLFASLWLLAEWARGVWFTGFPWIASGYAQLDAPLGALAPWVGVYGMGFAAAFIATLIASPWVLPRGQLAARSRRWMPAVAGAAALAFAAAAGPGEFTQPTGRLHVTLLQTNVPQDEKFAADHLPETLGWLAGQLQVADGELIVAPETAIPLLPDQLEPDFTASLEQRFRSGDRAALVGVPLFSAGSTPEAPGYTNSAVGWSKQSVVSPEGRYRYDKHHLVPFGEFIPTGFHWFTRMMNIPLGDFDRGPLVAPSFAVAKADASKPPERVAPNICYEDLFGEELAARFTDAATAPTIFANLSNIGWFGDTVAVTQHLQISRLRTLEFQRPMLRATNTGATAIVDHHGRVTHELPPFTRGALVGEVEGRSGLTPYAWWASRFGLWPLVLIAAVIVVGTAARRRRYEA